MRAGRVRRCPEPHARGAVFLLVASLLLLAWFPPPASAAPKADFGDAPDGKPAGYVTAPGVIGHFPSKAATPGPRHSPLGAFFLGANVSGERESAQVNKDSFDDGAGVSLAPCGSSTLRVVLNGKRLPLATRGSGHVAYINAWFDWNRDGDWADGSDGCSPEWAIQNLPVPMEKLSTSPIAVLPIGFTAGKKTKDIWERVTLTLDQPVSDASGGSATPYTQGETEDYLIPKGKAKPIFPPKEPRDGEEEELEEREEEIEEGRRKKKGRFEVSCAPNPMVIAHGGVATVNFVIADSGKGWIFGAFDGPSKGKTGGASVTPIKPQPPGVPAGWVAVDGFKFKSAKVDPPLRVEPIVIKFVFKRGKQTQKLACAVLVIHFGKGNTPFLPRIICGGVCRGAPPVSATPPTQPPVRTLQGGGTLEQQHPLTGSSTSFFDVFFDLDVDAFKVVLPGGNQISNPEVPPGSSYSCATAMTSTQNDTVLCTGNLLANAHATGRFNMSSLIAPNSAQLYGRQSGSSIFEGPFTVTSN